MSGRVLVLGTGKMARNVGSYGLCRGWTVSWVSRSRERLAEVEHHAQKVLRRLSRLHGEMPHASFHGYTDAAIPAPDVVIECVREDVLEKKVAVADIERFVNMDALLVSCSSSILPSRIHPACIGMHFFFPTELTGLVEVVAPEHCSPQRSNRAVDFARSWALEPLIQSAANAFAVNRMLLALQAEALRALVEGCPSSVVDACSRSPLLGTGQLTLMDMVGLDVIYAGVWNYLDMMFSDEIKSYLPLRDALAVLIDRGKRGAKNHDGLLCGSPLPWPEQRMDPSSADALRRRMLCVFLNACARFLDEGMFSEPELDAVLSSVFLAEAPWRTVLEREGRAGVAQWLSEECERTGISYFQPSRSLSD